MVTSTREALAWAAGYFDGEGHVAVSRRTGRDRANHTLRVDISQTRNPSDLRRFRDAVGVGRINGPYAKKNPLWSEHWVFSAHGFEKVQHIIATLWPWLGEKKRAQATAVLLEARSLYGRR
jgi:hypothetical protein